MTPIERVISLYDKPERFAEDMREFLASGYVISTPEVFLMGWADIENDTWHIYAGALKSKGESIQFLQYIPFSLKYVTFHRRGKPRTYKLEKLKCRIQSFSR